MSARSEPADPRRLRFARARRVVRGADFRRAYQHGSRARGEVLIVVAVANDLDHARLGLSVGRRIWKRAVRRNRVRRIFREAFRLAQHELPPGFDLILIPAAPRLDPRLEPTRAELVRLARLAAERFRAKAEARRPSP